jgi:dCMP deaminase
MVKWGEEGLGYNLTELCFDLLSDTAKSQLDSWKSNKEPVTRNSWHLYFILQAYLVSTRSLDAQTKCGCVLVKDNAIVGSGYNSFVRNINDHRLPNLRPDKYPFMIHAEHNAILNCARHGISCNATKAYITGPPCCNCLQYMYQAGVAEIYYANYNKANMTMNHEYDTQFEILVNLMQKIRIFCLDLDPSTIEKIETIKSL